MDKDKYRFLLFLCIAFLCMHLIVAAYAFVTMDADLNAVLRRSLDFIIDVYETIGFGEMVIGVSLVTLTLIGLAFWFRRQIKRSVS